MRTPALLVLLALGLTGCTAGAPGESDPNDPDQVEVVSLWTSGSEKRGYDALIREFTTQQPGLQFIDASVEAPGDGGALAALDLRLENDNPPDSFQAIAGAGTSGYVEDGRVQDLGSLYAEHGLDGVFRDTLLDLLRIDGRLFSIPVDVRRANLVWVDPALLRRAGIDAGAGRTTIGYWLDDLQRLRDAGVQYPLAIGDRRSQVQLFENVLLADLGPVVYKNLWTDPALWSEATLATPIAHYGALLEFVDPDSRGENSEDAVHRVVNGDAAYVVMIDSAGSAFELAATSGNEYAWFPVPGTAGVFDVSVDAFTLPVGAAHEAAARAWLLTTASSEAQRALTLEAGSIPARTDVDPEGFAAFQQDAMAALQSDTIAPSLAYGVAADPDWTLAITDAVAAFRDDRREVALLNALTAAARDASTPR